jgi:hypothetical protein
VPALVLGILALPVLPLVFLINPTLSQRITWTAEGEEWKQRSRERQERKQAIAEREREIAGKLAELDRKRAVEPGGALRQGPERLKLQRESHALGKEKLELTKEASQDFDRLGVVGRGRPRDPMPYLLPLGWGAVLYGLGWMLGRKKPSLEEKCKVPAGKHAIILRGPSAIGKSSVTELLFAKLPCGQARRVDLDQGWGEAENKRYPAGEGRYSDLNTPEDFLIIELCAGEPGGSMKGATTNPREWVEVLEKEGRLIHAFLLYVDKETWKKRLLKKVPAGDPGAEAYYDLFDLDDWKNFHAVAGVTEERIDTGTIDEKEVANRVWERVLAKSK